MTSKSKAGGTEKAGTVEFVAVYKPSDSDLFHIHAAGCADLGRAREEERTGKVSGIETVRAATALDAVRILLSEDFSGREGGEHPAANGYPAGSYGAAGFTFHVLPCCGRSTKPAPLPSSLAPTRASGYARECRIARDRAVAAGFVHADGRGYWTAVTAFCRANAIAHPATRVAGAPKVERKAPTAAELAAAKREATLARKREAEKARRLRIKAAKAGRK